MLAFGSLLKGRFFVTALSAVALGLFAHHSPIFAVAPVISGFGSNPLVFNEDGTGNTTFEVTYADNTTPIMVTAVSNDHSKILDADITISPSTGISGTRQISIVPVLNASGNGIKITLTASDGVDSSTADLMVNILPVNDPPTFANVIGINVPEDGTNTLSNVIITDVDGDSVTLSATSGNTTIVANNAITVTPASAASGTPRSIQVTGLPNKNGLVQINLSADDGNGGVVPASFNANITPVPDPPIITYPNSQAIPEDTSTGDLPFTIVDPDGDAITAVTPTSFDNLIPTANVTITSQGGANYTLRASPRPNDSGRWAAIRIRADSADNLFSQISFPITVTAVADAPVFATFPPTQTIVKSSTTGPLSFTSFDGDCIGAATVSAESTNTTLVPNTAANIAVRSLGVNAFCGQPANIGTVGMTATHEIIITPTANLTGVVVINVSVTDNTGLKVTRPLTVVVSFTNKAPEFLAQDNELVNTSMFEDSSTNLSFFVQDLDNDVIVASATSSNATLLPPGALTVNGTGGSRNLVIAPAANINGSAAVTVSLTDGISITTRSFLLSVLPVNDAPTISALTDQTIAFNSSTPAQPFTVGDVETVASALQISIASSNIGVIPLSNIVLGGSGANRTVQVNSGIVSGNSAITLTVSDGISTTSQSFMVVVAGNNQPPTISPIADQTIPRNGSVGPLAFTITDDLLPAGSLTLTYSTDNQALLPAGSIILAGSGGNRTIRITPAPNLGGTARITLTVTDGVYNTNRGFQIMVPTVGQPPTISPVTPPNPGSRVDAGVPSGSFTFTIADPDTPLDDLILSVVSSAPTIVPTNSVTFGGSGANRFAIITPLKATAGHVTITLIVRDGSGIASQSFPVHVWRNIYLGGSVFGFKPFNIESSESNNTYARAMPIITGIEYSGIVYSNSVSAQDTIDVLTLNLRQGTYRITLSFTGADLDVYLRDIAPSFKTLAKSDATSSEGPEVINYIESSTTPLTRYIVINLYSGSPGNKEYRIRVDKLP